MTSRVEAWSKTHCCTRWSVSGSRAAKLSSRMRTEACCVSGHRGGKGANLAKIGSAADCPNVAAGHQSSYLTSSADHLVCQYQERRRKCNPEGLSRLHVEDQLEFRGLLHGQVRRLGTLQHSVHIDRSTPEEVHI